MSIESKWDDFSPELKAEVQRAVHSGHDTFVPSPGVREEANEHTRDGGIFTSSTLSKPDENGEHSEQLHHPDAAAMPFTSDSFTISDRLAEHVRSLPEESSQYEDGAVIQEEHRTTVSTSPEDRDRIIYTD